MSHRRRSTSNKTRAVPAREAGDKSVSGAAPTSVLAIVVGVLMTARYLLPAESAALGETLWIVQLWLIAAVVWLWMTARNGQSLRRWDRLDVGLCLLIGGHVLSALLLIFTEGDRRAALNMLWEWIGIGAAAAMIREAVRQETARTRLLDLIVTAAIVLSGLGLWQHHVWYPSIAAQLAEFDRLRTTAPADPDEAVAREETLRRLSRELGPLLSNGDPGSNEMMRARVSASTEPIGRFALANTFAALLLVALLLALARLHRELADGRMSWRGWVSGALLVGVAYCFWLTKSRTAAVGLFTGLGAWGVLSWQRRGEGGERRSERQATRDKSLGTGDAEATSQASDLNIQNSVVRPRLSALRSPLWALLILLIGLPVVAALSGGLDRQVITEAPKSLQYRLEYWTATGEVLREHPVFGAGPGNFRQAYLQHKLPGSSEEVLDPHNLVLDVWANGGLLALAGLVWSLAVVGGRVRWLGAQEGSIQAAVTSPRPSFPHSDVRRVWSVRCATGIAALVLAAFVSLMNGSSDADDVLWLAAGWCAVSFIWPMAGSLRWPVIAAAGVALVVHLLGAGGTSMPAILQTLVLLAACVMAEPREVNDHSPIGGLPDKAFDPLPTLPWQPMLGAGVCLCLAIACAFTSTLPVSTARTQVQLGRATMSEGGQLAQAMRSFEAAIEADPLAAEPWQELAIAHATDWQRLAGSDDAAFENAVQAQQEAIRHDPRAAGGWQMLGELWWLRFEAHQQVEAAREAASAFREAAARYPHLASLQASLARASQAMGDEAPAKQAARHALELDDANRAAGHTDKYLPGSLRTTLTEIAGEDASGL